MSTGSDPVDKVGRLPAAEGAKELGMRWRVVAVLCAGRVALAQMKSRMKVKMEAMAAAVEVEAIEVEAAEVETAEMEAAAKVDAIGNKAAGMEAAEIAGLEAEEGRCRWQRVSGMLEGRSRDFRGLRVAMKVQQLKVARELELEEYHMEWLEQYKGTEAAKKAEQQFGEERRRRRQQVLTG